MNTQRKWLWAIGATAAGAALVAFGVPLEYVLIGGFLLLCPAMMLFMGGHNTDGDSRKGPSGGSTDAHAEIPGKQSR